MKIKHSKSTYCFQIPFHNLFDVPEFEASRNSFKIFVQREAGHREADN